MKGRALSSSMSVIYCDRCGKSVTFDVLNPPRYWNKYNIMDVDVILCPKCGKAFNQMVLSFMRNDEGIEQKERER